MKPEPIHTRPHSHDLKGGVEEFDLVGTFAITEPEVIGRLFISADHGRIY